MQPDTERNGTVGSSANATENRAPAVFEETYVRYAPLLRRIAVAKFRIKQEDAEGLVQDVFATFFLHVGSVERVEPYLVGAICNAARKHLQRVGPGDELFCDEHPCAATPGEALLHQVERQQLLSRIFARIGSRCRELLSLYYVHGESTAAIADGLESTPGSVRVRLHKCRQRAVAAYRSIMGTS
jgi:RNA polymerase sigma factor (sigma-70 family)